MSNAKKVDSNKEIENMLYMSTKYGQTCLKQEIFQFVLSLEYSPNAEEVALEFDISIPYAKEILEEIDSTLSSSLS